MKIELRHFRLILGPVQFLLVHLKAGLNSAPTMLAIHRDYRKFLKDTASATMKKLHLQIIVEIMNGKIEQGTDNLIIHDIGAGTKRIKQGTLLFDLHRHQYNPKIYQENRPYTIVTDRPANFNGLTENICLVS